MAHAQDDYDHLRDSADTDRAPRTMSIPEVRDRLYTLAEIQRLPELRQLADQLWRRPPWRKPVRAQSRAMTPDLAYAIRQFAADHPEESEHRIGLRFGVNQGRVSEAIRGHRT
jgi:hypothetical protein